MGLSAMGNSSFKRVVNTVVEEVPPVDLIMPREGTFGGFSAQRSAALAARLVSEEINNGTLLDVEALSLEVEANGRDMIRRYFSVPEKNELLCSRVEGGFPQCKPVKALAKRGEGGSRRELGQKKAISGTIYPSKSREEDICVSFRLTFDEKGPLAVRVGALRQLAYLLKEDARKLFLAQARTIWSDEVLMNELSQSERHELNKIACEELTVLGKEVPREAFIGLEALLKRTEEKSIVAEIKWQMAQLCDEKKRVTLAKEAAILGHMEACVYFHRKAMQEA